ncbi:MAG: septum site-determining protein MinC [Deltaproteobacteria bacterium]
MEPGKVNFKGMKDALIIMLDEQQDFDELMQELTKKLEASVNFLKGVNYPVRVKGRELSSDEFKIVAAKIKEITGLDVSAEEGKPNQAASKEKAKKPENTELKSMFYGIDEGMTKFHRGTLRSGQLVKFHGNVVVIGDANPGSEIVASGNIVVLGTVRGILHAGATGNKQAVAVAFNLHPTQLRIADIITRPPEEKFSKAQLPEIAYIKDDNIYIEYYLPNK